MWVTNRIFKNCIVVYLLRVSVIGELETKADEGLTSFHLADNSELRYSDHFFNELFTNEKSHSDDNDYKENRRKRKTGKEDDDDDDENIPKYQRELLKLLRRQDRKQKKKEELAKELGLPLETTTEEIIDDYRNRFRRPYQRDGYGQPRGPPWAERYQPGGYRNDYRTYDNPYNKFGNENPEEIDNRRPYEQGPRRPWGPNRRYENDKDWGSANSSHPSNQNDYPDERYVPRRRWDERQETDNRRPSEQGPRRPWGPNRRYETDRDLGNANLSHPSNQNEYPDERYVPRRRWDERPLGDQSYTPPERDYYRRRPWGPRPPPVWAQRYENQPRRNVSVDPYTNRTGERRDYFEERRPRFRQPWQRFEGEPRRPGSGIPPSDWRPWRAWRSVDPKREQRKSRDEYFRAYTGQKPQLLTTKASAASDFSTSQTIVSSVGTTRLSNSSVLSVTTERITEMSTLPSNGSEYIPSTESTASHYSTSYRVGERKTDSSYLTKTTNNEEILDTTISSLTTNLLNLSDKISSQPTIVLNITEPEYKIETKSNTTTIQNKKARDAGSTPASTVYDTEPKSVIEVSSTVTIATKPEEAASIVESTGSTKKKRGRPKKTTLSNIISAGNTEAITSSP